MTGFLTNRTLKPSGERRAITFIDVLTTVTLLGFLATLTLPAIQSARESARRTACGNNLKQVALAVANYEATHRMMPIGARGAPFRTMGVSWMVDILTELGEPQLYEQIVTDAPHSGLVLLHARNRRAQEGIVLPQLRCPSSPLSALYGIGQSSTTSMMPSYVGVAGATSHDGFQEERVSLCCWPRIDGEISGGGALPPNRAIRLREFSDGVSRTVFAGEASDYLLSPDSRLYRTDGAFPNGWIAGTSATGTPPNYSPGAQSWSITSIRYPLNKRDYPAKGIHNARGANNPLISPHPRGVHLASVDGSVRFANDDASIDVLKRLATRDDGRVE